MGGRLIRIVIKGLSSHVSISLVTLDLEDALNICEKLNRRLGFDRKTWTAMAANSMREEEPEGDSLH